MKLLTKNLTVCLCLIGLGAMPCFAKIEGIVSKHHFYDLEKTIMTDVQPNTTSATEKYWEKNLFYSNKYHPLFMLSNKELYNLMPEKKTSIVQRINTPSVYNISLKNATINKIALATPSKKSETPKKKAVSEQKDMQATYLYEQAKNQETDIEKKTDTAIVLKNTKNPSNYNMAIDLLNDVTKQEPYNAYAFYIKGELYYAKNDRENAMKNYTEALRLNPYSKQSCLGIAKILEPTNKELAQKYYDRAELAETK